jgi:PKD repeat protein
MATATVHINLPPLAEAGPDCFVCQGEEVVFNGSECRDRDGSVKKYVWSFGDGATGEGKEVVHAYDQHGKYQVRLSIHDDSGTSCGVAEDTMAVMVNASPIAAAGPDLEVFFGGAYDVVVFDGTRSFDPDGHPLTYHWEFGDGSVGTGPRVSHAYKTAGIYTVRLRVSDGAKTTCSESVDELKVKVKSRAIARRLR